MPEASEASISKFFSGLLENPSASVHPKRFSTPSLTPKFLCAGKLNPRFLIMRIDVVSNQTQHALGFGPRSVRSEWRTMTANRLDALATVQPIPQIVENAIHLSSRAEAFDDFAMIRVPQPMARRQFLNDRLTEILPKATLQLPR